jgi:hypothetical protein
MKAQDQSNQEQPETLQINAAGLEEGIEELIKFNDPEGRDLSITMTVLEQVLAFLNQPGQLKGVRREQVNCSSS